MAEFNGLTMKEIFHALAHVPFSRAAHRSKAALLLEIEQLDEGDKSRLRDLQDQISRAKEEKQTLKRKLTDEHGPRRVRRRMNPVEAEYERVHDTNLFMRTPSRQDILSAEQDFYLATGNDALAQVVCVSCAGEFFRREMERIRFDDLPNGDLLIPRVPHRAHVLRAGKLIAAIALHEEYVWLCAECSKDLRRSRLPAWALANRMWIGETPFVLRVLTISEMMLIAHHYPRVFQFKMYPKSLGRGVDPEALQSGMRGNVSTYALNQTEITRMIEGKLFPRPLAVLSSVIAVAFIGLMKMQDVRENWLKKTFAVRRDNVHRALLWLKENNRFYKDLDLDDRATLSRLRDLPDDGVPVEILANIRHEESSVLLERENDGYVHNRDEMRDGEAIDPEERDVVPLHYIGVSDTDLTRASTNELFLYALAQAEADRKEGGYAVRHSRRPISEFGKPLDGQERDANLRNPLAAAFIGLFPYGEGGLEDEREVEVSFQEHARWTLRYFDRRFRIHASWIFVVFGILQKRQALLSARLQMRRRDFNTVSAMLSRITIDDLKLAASEEESGLPASNPAVRTLKKQIYALGGRVMGSDQSRISLRSRIWGTSIYLNPAALWVTINPSDLNDPIVQVFAGEEIDMDRFIVTAGPDRKQRAVNVAKDPYAAAKFFHFIIKAVLKCLFRIEREGGGRGVTSQGGRYVAQDNGYSVRSAMGILGELAAYFGVVEAQGRAALHFHLLLWLMHAPTSEEMHRLLKDGMFRERIINYIKTVIRAHHPDLTLDSIDSVPKDPECAYSRPPNPASASYEAEAVAMERAVVRTEQPHSCSTLTCLVKTRSGAFKCKRRAPFPLAETDTIDEKGNWFPRRTHPFLNNWNPSLARAMRCNHDIKLLTNGEDTKDLSFYITNYAAKKQGRTFNMSGLLAKNLSYHMESTDYLDDIRNRNRLMLYRCFNILNREQDQAHPQCTSYIMGWGDVFSSGKHVPIYWSAVVAEILRRFPDLNVSSRFDVHVVPEDNHISHEDSDPAQTSQQLEFQHEASNSDGESDADVEPNTDVRLDASSTIRAGGFRSDVHGSLEDDNIILEASSTGHLRPKATQVVDYIFRGEELKDLPLLFFLVDTYEEDISKSSEHASQKHADGDESDADDDDGRGGRPRHQRSSYLAPHPHAKTRQRVCRRKNHNFFPSFFGRSFPRNNDRDIRPFYCACVLTLLKPWRDLVELRPPGQSWEDSLSAFLSGAPKRIHDIICNLQFFYEGRDAAAAKRARELAAGVHLQDDRHMFGDPARNVAEADDDDDPVVSAEMELLTEEDFELLEESQTPWREQLHGMQALQIAQTAGIFRNEEREWPVAAAPISTATSADLDRLAAWKSALAQNAVNLLRARHGETTTADPERDSGSVQRLDDMGTADVVHLTQEDLGLGAGLEAVTLNNLRPDQMRAFKIVDSHLEETLAGHEPPQLLMLIQGEGGTGKSRVIQTITDSFAKRGQLGLLLKSSYMGIAASIIDGYTIHHIGMIPLNGKEPSKETRQKLAAFWARIRYLIIDEISMVPKQLLALLSRIVSIARTGTQGTDGQDPFGGINVILAGDFHQFPPVASRENAPLYYPLNPAKDTFDDRMGRLIYEQFRTVVILREQMRVTDPVWMEFLRRARHGSCTEDDLTMLKKLIIDNPECPTTDFSKPPWSNAVLITPRHAVRTQWNEAAITRHCKAHSCQLFISSAQDTIRGRPLTPSERYSVATKRSSKRRTRKERSGLPHKVPLAIGMEVMVTLNVQTDLDVANGARGKIVDIVLHPDEPPISPTQSQVKLRYPPAYVLVKLHRTKADTLAGLEPGVIPIEPVKRQFKILTSSGREKTVTRLQLPITAAYAFTDFRAQGQTIPYVIADIGHPPSGRMTPFNAYVSLSRSAGRSNIRLLRKFDDELFTQHPSQYLRLEDRRLEELDRSTKEAWLRTKTRGE